jgi:magnesium-transporting ATPase (P-type)
METEKSDYRIKPGFSSSFGTGWEVMMNNFLRLFLLVIILGIVAAPLKTLDFKFHPGDFGFNHWDAEDFFRIGTFGVLAAFYAFIGLLYAFLVAPVFRYGGKLMFVQSVRKDKLDFETLIKGFRENYLSIILANLLVTALVALGLFALIIPGIIIGCRLAFTAYLVMDKKLDPIEAVETSWRMTRGHGWTIFLMGFSSFFIYIFGLIMLLVGIFPAMIWVSSSFASLYQSVLNEKEALTEAVTV